MSLDVVEILLGAADALVAILSCMLLDWTVCLRSSSGRATAEALLRQYFMCDFGTSERPESSTAW